LEQVVSFFFKYRPSLFEKSQFALGARPSFIWIALIAILLAALIYFIYIRPGVRLPAKWRVALISTRVLLLALIIFVLMRPVIVAPSVVPGSSYVAVLMDDSASMKLADQGPTTRLEAVRQAMSPAGRFYAELADKFKIRAYRFSSRTERITDGSELTGEGEKTDLAAALDHASRDMAGLPVSGIIVMSDGATNAESSSNFDSVIASLRGRGLPVFSVGVGGERIEGDVELVRATAPRRVLANSPASAEVLLRANGYDRKTIRVDIAEDGRALRSQEVIAPQDATAVARVTFTPLTPGVHRYTITAVGPAEDPVPENNSQEVIIEVEDSHPKVLYMEGEPRWEYGKIREAMSEEKNVVLVSVLRSADGKYYRQGVEHAEDLAQGFPTSEEDLFRYDAVVIGSVEATFFSFDQLRAIEQFVLRRGGTLLALGGTKALSAGGYFNTPFADMLPVHLNNVAPPPAETQTFKPFPSERGREHPAARLVEDADANLKAWDQIPAITLPEVITQIKPGATVVLEARSVKDKSRAVPLLVEERYGRGRTMTLLASDTWRWRMMLESKNKSFDIFWKNLLRYTVESTRKKVEAATDRPFYGRLDPVQLRVEVADDKYMNVGDAQVFARVVAPSGKTTDVALKHILEGGFEGYAAQFVPEEEGLHKVEISAQRVASSKDKTPLSPAQTSFIVGQVNYEARNAALNRELLARAAADTGGKYYALDETGNLVEDLTHTESASSQKVAYDLWDMPINFLLAVALASAEWLIRKRKGLA
jgi:uncharacterized membrane protein